MKTIHTVSEMRATTTAWKQEGHRVILVPTMGNLHEGHLQLAREGLIRGDRVVVSIFVNPLQFGEGEDFDEYPRTLEADSRLLAEVGAHAVFAPSVEEVYPKPLVDMSTITVPHISDIFCGASRPGHFVGVATVVAKLFNMVLPDSAIFGEKDFQQLMVIRRMVADLQIPVEVLGVATVREEDGLAMSSRNGYLTAQERKIAPTLNVVITKTAEALQSGEQDLQALQAQANSALAEAGFEPDYFHIRRADDLGNVSDDDKHLVILAAARLGKARLIDNRVVNR